LGAFGVCTTPPLIVSAMSDIAMLDAHPPGQDDSTRGDLQRQMSCTQPYIELGETSESLDLSQSVAERKPVAILRSLVAGLIPTVEVFSDVQDVIIGRIKEVSNAQHLIVSVQDKRVSAEHCRVWRVNHNDQTPEAIPAFVVQDNSSNGTYLNGVRLTKGRQYPMQSGDELSLVVNSCQRRHLGTRSRLCCAFVLRVCGVERSSVLKDAGNMVEDKYDLLSKVLGSGAFSQVLLCKSRSTGASMALKVVDKNKFLQFRKSRQTELTIESEREVMEKIDHPNIVRLQDSFDTPKCFYLVMEFLPGGDLLQRILDHGIYSAGTTRRLFCDVLSGIKCLHDKGIAHRDIKPENILLTSVDEDGTAKIADMGLAKYFGGEFATVQVQRATVCGTPHYFAPEMVLAAEGGPSSYGKAVDMWAAGVVLYILLCGFPPFDEENLYDQIASGKYDFEGEQWASVSALARDLVEKLMRVNADERLVIAESLSHPWMVGGVPVKRRKTLDADVADRVLGHDSDFMLDDSLRSRVRKIATPAVYII